MKSLHALLFGLLLALLTPAQALAALNVVTTTQDLAALTRAVGGDQVNITAIVRGDLDPHFVDAKPSYMAKMSTADLVIAVGMELEVGWLPSLLTGARNPKVQPGTMGYLDASTAVRAIEVPSGTIDRSRGDLHPMGNPHYWLNPENGRLVARLIAGRLAQLDPPHTKLYTDNLAAFEAKLTTKEAEWSQKMAALKGTNVVGYHMTFDYLFDAYGLNVVGFVEPKPGIPPTPAHTLELAGTAKSAGARFIAVEQYHNPADANPVANGSGAKVVVLPTSVGAEKGIEDYFQLFDHIVAQLAG